MEWPKEGDRLFTLGKDWQLNACINCYHHRLSHLANGYKQGADALAHAAAEGKATLDIVIYPVVFLYRQYLELMLKEIISLLKQLDGEAGQYPFHHKLTELWREAKQRLKSHYGDDTPAELENIDPCVADFGTYDPDSFAFRYPTSKKGDRNLEGLTHINLRILHDSMERLTSILDCLECDLSMKLDGLHDMQSYYS